ncbi:MAG: hemolysin III family protein [Firmicutes bacterium]|nr:hemolysin III family protein [Bacillota bacterium]
MEQTKEKELIGKEVSAAKEALKSQTDYSKKEELFNIISHAVGTVLASVGTTIMLIRVLAGAHRGDYASSRLAILSIYLYGIALISLFLMSTLYHSQKTGSKRREVFRRLDHCLIAVIIAASYAPYMLIGMLQSDNSSDWIWSIIIASVVLNMAVVVVVLKAINPKKFKLFCLIAFIVMGWASVVRIHRVFIVISPGAFWFLLGGGIAYTIGVIFFRWKSLKFNHVIWHIFVLIGAALHFASVNFFIL